MGDYDSLFTIKIGMPPKRVFVEGTDSVHSNARSNDEDDELDYVANPFGGARK